MAIQESFVTHASFRWVKITLLLLAIFGLVYSLDNPIGGPNGGTVLGYSYGGIATFFILYLMWFGVRKRSYSSTVGTLKGWLSAHVWIGIMLLLLVPLHSAFSFGLNVHTLAYGLMCLTILSGIWGALNYSLLADQVGSHRGEGTAAQMLEQIDSLSQRIKSIDLGANAALQSLTAFEAQPPRNILSCLKAERPKLLDASALAKIAAQIPDSSQAKFQELIQLISKKHALCNKLRQEIRAKTLLRLWLYLHLPLSFALLAALAVHIFSVFYYW